MNRRKLIKYDDILSGKGLKEAIPKPKTHPPMPKCIPPRTDKYETITVTMKNGKFAEWKKDEWDDYTYDGKFFIVIKNEAWIGFYNLDEIRTIVVE